MGKAPVPDFLENIGKITATILKFIRLSSENIFSEKEISWYTESFINNIYKLSSL